MKSLGDFNELSINPMKTNFMLIKSAKKKKRKKLNTPLNMVLPNNKGTNSSLELKDHVKYLDVMIKEAGSITSILFADVHLETLEYFFSFVITFLHLKSDRSTTT